MNRHSGEGGGWWTSKRGSSKGKAVASTELGILLPGKREGEVIAKDRGIWESRGRKKGGYITQERKKSGGGVGERN